MCGNKAINGLTVEPGWRYSGSAPLWLLESVFVLLKERFRLFPLCMWESATTVNKHLGFFFFYAASPLLLEVKIVRIWECIQCVCTCGLYMCYSPQHTWWATFSQSILGSRSSQQIQHTSKMDSGCADAVRFWNNVEHDYTWCIHDTENKEKIQSWCTNISMML